MAQPSAPQFSSSQAVIWAWRWPKSAGRNADPDADREAPLGHRDNVARVTRHLEFLIRSHSRSHGYSAPSSRLGLPLSKFARAREPSRIVDGDLEAMQTVDAEIQVRT
jgi:hypothetical protein